VRGVKVYRECWNSRLEGARIRVKVRATLTLNPNSNSAPGSNRQATGADILRVSRIAILFYGVLQARV